VTFKRYTGQEKPDERRRILADPPDILLTNYVMLELVLTRPDERQHLVKAAKGLRFLALDELHTYRGRQGADVAMLIRRLRDQCDAENLQVIGTSATMSSEGTAADQKQVVADVATRLFGSEVTPERVIGETLVRATAETIDGGPALTAATAAAARGEIARDYDGFVIDPLASWAETTFGLDIEIDPATGQAHLIRSAPTTVPEAAERLAAATGLDEQQCAEALKNVLRSGSKATNPATKRPVFAFRLHQFLSKGDTVYVSLEPEDSRHITGTYQVSVPGKRDHALLPLGFCRECGQEYMVVAKTERGGVTSFVSRRDADASGGDSVTGYLYVSSDLPWPDDPQAEGRLPENWLVADPDTGELELLDSKRKYLPAKVSINHDGSLDQSGSGLTAWFMSTPFAFCLRCGVSYEQVRGADFGKLATLDAEGRSSAVSLLSAAVVRALRGKDAADLGPAARKLLTFVDNRQDASLQAGHFNDFVQVTQLRGALYQALQQAGENGLTHEDLAANVTKALSLTPKDFAQAPEAKFTAKADAERALRSVVEYQLYVDLQRGWRVTMPNLEQAGLLTVSYRDLPELAADADSWRGKGHLEWLDADKRRELAHILLDEFRRVRAIDADILTDDGFDKIKRASRASLIEPWAMGEDDRLVDVGTVIPRPAKAGGRRGILTVTSFGAFGRHLRRGDSGLPSKLDRADIDTVITDLLAVLTDAGLTTRTGTSDGPEYRLNAGSLIWHVGDGTRGATDPLRRRYQDGETARVNPFFRDLYQHLADGYSGLAAREHTAQVPQPERIQREDDFREGRLPLLFCSPTMELGVDIADLNAVGLRNVPPTPANYAQRSGRAGRSGQQALVLTYCATGNAHDSYWFRRSREMVAGSVIAPRLDLTNEDLIRSHVHAIWLAETNESMHSSITELLEAGGEAPGLNVIPELWESVNDPRMTARARVVAERVLGELRRTWAADGVNPAWWSETWVTEQIGRAAMAFDQSFDRWRVLYRTALAEYHEQNKVAVSTSASKWDRKQAERRRADARNQLALLRNDDVEYGATDFYSYRYLASEGFLPGYSFPRLPLAAYIPARRGGKYDGDYLQRPRFVAISEFGPNALIYHEGARYEVTRIQLPRAADGAPAGGSAAGTATESVKRCQHCGYHHDGASVTDMCEHCGERLAGSDSGLLRLQTVFTRRRERISSDEEERRRAGYELETSFRFADRGDRPSHTAAQAVNAAGEPIVMLDHGDAAIMRVANVGRRRRKNPSDRGYWLDVQLGQWLTDKQAADRTVDADGLDSKDDVAFKQKVIPYVEDRRNILLVRLADGPVSDELAATLRAALERGIEATFQLEDAELDAIALPDSDGRGRMLLTEAAEGGAGVLSRLVEEPDALRRVARAALEIIHYDPDTGADLGHAPGARERCEKGCYDCLLAYSNQYEHTLIDRHLVVELLREISRGTVTAGSGGKTRAEQQAWLNKLRDSELEKRFVDWLVERGYRLPDDAQITVDAARARPDLVYRLADSPVAVFVDGPHHDGAMQQARDAAAAERLEDCGWAVVRIRFDEDWQDWARANAWLVGSGRASI
jgi:hypothetical protein